MIRVNVNRKSVAFCATLCGTLLVLPASRSVADPPAASPDAKAAAAAPVKGEVIDVPAGKPEELLQFIRRLLRTRPAGQTREQMRANYMEMQRAVVKAADKLLADKAVTDDESGQRIVAAGIAAKLRALGLLERLDDKAAAGQIKELLDKYAGDKRPLIATLVAQAVAERRFSLPHGADLATARAMVADAKEHFRKTPLEPKDLGPLLNLAQAVEHAGFHKEAAELYQWFGEELTKSKEPQLAALGPKFVATARRLGLVGKPIEVFGKQLDGKELDWNAYRGKVVLVDFWATWCGPCLAELPNQVTEYRAYHDRGFEVIAVSLDSKRDEVEQFVKAREIAWPILFSDDPKATGTDHPLAAHHGVFSIPLAILVDREGKVVSLNARGPVLGNELEKLLGPAEKSGEKKPDKAVPQKPTK